MTPPPFPRPPLGSCSTTAPADQPVPERSRARPPADPGSRAARLAGGPGRGRGLRRAGPAGPESGPGPGAVELRAGHRRHRAPGLRLQQPAAGQARLEPVAVLRHRGDQRPGDPDRPADPGHRHRGGRPLPGRAGPDPAERDPDPARGGRAAQRRGPGAVPARAPGPGPPGRHRVLFGRGRVPGGLDHRGGPGAGRRQPGRRRGRPGPAADQLQRLLRDRGLAGARWAPTCPAA